MTRFALFALVAPFLAASTSAFSARSVTNPSLRETTVALQSSMSSLSEAEAAYMMAKARECAFSDSCSVEESREHLHDILNIQVACASGTVAGQDVCDDQQELAEIVSRLRVISKDGTHGLTTRQQAMTGASVLPISFLALTCASMVLANANPGVVPFTPQEIMWAVRDGYLDDLVTHFLRNGGLNIGSDAVPFTTQELAWAIRDGYFNDFMAHFLRNGGL